MKRRTENNGWDPVVRYGHWLLAGAFFTAYFSAEEIMSIHTWAGYTVAVVALFRIAWGFLGPVKARFGTFVRSPQAAIAYLRDLAIGRVVDYPSHNPAGGLMVVALLLSLLGTAGTGMALHAMESDAGPLAPWLGTAAAGPIERQAGNAHAGDDEHEEEHERREHREHGRNSGPMHDDQEETVEEVHEFFANLTLALVVVHVLGVVASSLASGRNLVRGMLAGRRRKITVASRKIGYNR